VYPWLINNVRANLRPSAVNKSGLNFLTFNLTMMVIELIKKYPLQLSSYCIFLLATLLSACSYDGEILFQKEGCATCHTVMGKGGRLGPDLTGVTNIRDDVWINRYINNPKKINPLARMPSFPYLSRGKRKAIIAYLKK
jgi:cytochrome c2